jgi:hypothetical protein
MKVSGGQELLLPHSLATLSLTNNFNFLSNPNSFSSMRSTFILLRSLSLSLSNLHRPSIHSSLHPRPRQFPRLFVSFQHAVRAAEEEPPENDAFRFERGSASAADEWKQLRSPEVEVMELSEVPEEWRRARVAWLCKELPAHKAGNLVKILNAQRKWMRQEDATYIVMHCLRIRENETGFKVYMSSSYYTKLVPNLHFTQPYCYSTTSQFF